MSEHITEARLLESSARSLRVQAQGMLQVAGDLDDLAAEHRTQAAAAEVAEQAESSTACESGGVLPWHESKCGARSEGSIVHTCGLQAEHEGHHLCRGGVCRVTWPVQAESESKPAPRPSPGLQERR